VENLVINLPAASVALVKLAKADEIDRNRNEQAGACRPACSLHHSSF
jgi:hypothetical protein